MTSQYGFQPSPVDLAFKTVCLPPDLQVSIGATPRLWIYACKTAFLAPE